MVAAKVAVVVLAGIVVVVAVVGIFGWRQANLIDQFATAPPVCLKQAARDG